METSGQFKTVREDNIEDNIVNRKVENKVYAKNSMDRFGDDLTEEILQYMTFEDKIRLECVSKQWKRCVFEKQFVIVILSDVNIKEWDYHYLFDIINVYNFYRNCVSFECLEAILKKCSNIKKINIKIQMKSFVLSLISQYCHNIKSLIISIDYLEDMTFFRDNGHKLEELRICGTNNNNNNNNQQILKFCPNLKYVFVYPSDIVFTEDKEILPKLEEIDEDLKSESIYIIKILSNKYNKTMKKMIISFSFMTEEELKTCIECIARFENLKVLTLEFGYLKITEPIDKSVSMIGQKCTKLLKLNLSIKYIPITDRFLDVFSNLKAIKSLRVCLPNTAVKGSIESLKHCKQLIYLDINYYRLTEDFFANIATFVPKLQFLIIITNEQFSDSFIKSFNCLKNLQRVEHFFDNANTYRPKNSWYFNKNRIRSYLCIRY